MRATVQVCKIINYACMHVFMCVLNIFTMSKLRDLVIYLIFFSDAVEGPPLVPGSGEIIEVDNLIK